MNDFLSFRKMITPVFIQVIFWIAVAMCVIAALISMVSPGGFAGILSGLLMLVIGPFVVRIYCELLIIMFRIYDELVAIRTGTPPTGQGFPVMPPAPQGYAPPMGGGMPPQGPGPMAR
jgi:hypothetical protein